MSGEEFPTRRTLWGPTLNKCQGNVWRSLADLSSLPEMRTGSRSAPLRNSATRFPAIIYSFVTRRSTLPRISPLSFWSGKGGLWNMANPLRRTYNPRQGSLGSPCVRPCSRAFPQRPRSTCSRSWLLKLVTHTSGPLSIAKTTGSRAADVVRPRGSERAAAACRRNSARRSSA
jgi:hypothetical protein